MKPLALLACLFAFGAAYAAPPVWVSASLEGTELGQTITFYDDAEGELTCRIACAPEPDKVELRWSIAAGELVAPLGEFSAPAKISYEAPFLDVSLALEPAPIKAPQARILEIVLQLPDGPQTLLLPTIVYPATERETCIKNLARAHLVVDQDLHAVTDLLDYYQVKFKRVNASRALQADGPGVYFLGPDAAMPSNRGATLFHFKNRSTPMPVLKIGPGEATLTYFDNLNLLGNAGAEMLVLQTAESLSQPPAQITPARHEEPLF